MQDNDLNSWQRIRLELAWWSAKLFAILPYWFKYYVVESLLYLILRYLIRYRKQVVDTNLRNAFPEKSDAERAIIRNKFYITLAEIMVDTINMAHMPLKKMHRVISVTNLDTHMKEVDDRDWITLTAHFGCWEYCTYWGAYEPAQVIVAVYHPLRNVVLDRLYQRLRNSSTTTTVAMHDCLRFYLRHRESGLDGRRMVMGLVADQNPPRRPDSHWFRFLNQDTIFFDGGEKLALRCHLPVYYACMKRVRRGCYELTFEKIYDGIEPVEPNEIIERYVRRLETDICANPDLWMWSHRRWKHKRTK